MDKQPETLKLPEAVRKELQDLQNAINSAGRQAFLWLGLDPNLPHNVDLVNGIVIPFGTQRGPQPTPIKAEEAAS